MSWYGRQVISVAALCLVLSACGGGDSEAPDSTEPDAPTASSESAASSVTTTFQATTATSASASTESTAPDVALVPRSDATGVVSALAPEGWVVTGDGPNDAGGISWQLRSDRTEPGPSLWAFAGGLDQSESDALQLVEFLTMVRTCDTDARVERDVTGGVTATTRYDYPSCRDDRQGTVLRFGEESAPLAVVAVVTDTADGIHEEIVASVVFDPDGTPIESDAEDDETAAAGLTRVVDDSGRLVMDMPSGWDYSTQAASSGGPFIGASTGPPGSDLLNVPGLQAGIASADGNDLDDTIDLLDTLLDEFGVTPLVCDTFAPTPWAIEGAVGNRVSATSCGPDRLDVSAFVGSVLGTDEIVFLIVSTETGAPWTAQMALDLLEVR